MVTGGTPAGPGSRAIAILAAALALSMALPLVGPAANAQTGDGLTIAPARSVFEPGESVRLTVWNNGTAPRQGVPTILVHHCPTAGLCAATEEQVHEWRGEETHLAPGQNMTVRWDRRTTDGSDAPEGAYEAHLRWNGTAGTRDGQADSRRFDLRNGTATPDPDAPDIRIVSPLDGDRLPTGPVPFEVEVTGKTELREVRVSLDGRVVEVRQDISQRQVTVSGSVALPPGSHVLHASAQDAQDRANRTTTLFAVIPRPPAGPLGVTYDPIPEGGLADIRVGDTVVFEQIRPDRPSTPMEATMHAGALVIRSPARATVHHDLAPGWHLSEHPGGFALSGPDGERRALLVADAERIDASNSSLSLDLEPSGQIVVRPIGGHPAEERIAQAILDGQVAGEVEVQPDGSVSAVRYASGAVDATGQPHRLRLDVTATTSEGRVVAVSISDGAPFGDELAVRLDGQRTSDADGLSDVLDPSDDGTRDESLVVDTGDERRVLVSVSSFSTRSIVVETVEAVGAFITPGAVLGGLVVVGAAAWGLFRRREA